MDIGEMQKRLSLKAEQQPDHRFDDLFSLICREDWLMLAHDHVAGNAGSQTAGCDGINMRTFDEDLGDNLKDLRGSLEEGTFRLTRNGASMHEVREFAGHADIRTTEVYFVRSAQRKRAC